ncbi:MAG: TolC family protein [Syntrophaceae bacterium]
MNCKAAFLILFLIAPAIASAAEPAPLSMQESIDIALKQSAAIHSASEGVNAAESRKKEALTGFLPTLSTYYSYTRLNEAPQVKFEGTGFTPVVTGTADNYNWAVQARQPVFAGGSIVSTYQISKLGEDISRYDKLSTVHDVVLDVKVSYYNILKSERIREVARQSVDQLASHAKVARNFYEVGLIPKNDLLQSEVQLANGNQDLVRADNSVEIAKSQFNTVLRRDINRPVAVRDILVYEPFLQNIDDCLKTAMENRPEIKSYEVRRAQSGKAVDLAKSEYYPTVNVVGTYGRYGDQPNVSGSLFQDAENWSVLAVANWNFWEWGRTKHRVDAGRSRESQSADALTIVRDRITLEVKNSYLQMREAEKRIAVAGQAITQAEENFRINQERYKEQVATTTDVIDAQTLLTRAKSDYFNALSDFNIARSRLERSMGVIK